MAITLRHAALAVLVMAVWGFNYVASKVAVTAVPPIFLMAIRFALTALVLVPFAPRPTRQQLPRLLLVAFTLGGVHFSLMFTGLKGLDASTTAIASQSQVPFAAMLAAIVFKERLGWRNLAGIVIALGGVALIAGEPRFGSHPVPLVLVVAASLVWAVSNIEIKGFTTPIGGLTLVAWISLLAVPQLLLVSALLETGQRAAIAAAGWPVLGAILYMCLAVTVFGYGVWYYLLGRYPINQMMAFTLLVPLFGVLSGVLALDDHLGWRLLAGGAATVGGVAVIVLRRPRMVIAAARRET
jgi:O-acetylserine/cysteine efflux transporter